jgi:hypothetical protein
MAMYDHDMMVMITIIYLHVPIVCNLRLQVSLENKSLRGGGASTKKKIWNGLRPILEEWTGQRLVETSLYGVRVYKDGAMLSSHVDRLPLITSCIIHVASDLDEPWPVEVPICTSTNTHTHVQHTRTLIH